MNWVMSGECTIPLPRMFSHPIGKLQPFAVLGNSSSKEGGEGGGGNLCEESEK